jgi:transcriptional regulator with XRE-family HTH domain
MSAIQKQIGQRIQLLRDAAGLTQAQLADRAGVNPEHISRIERAEKGPSIELLDRIASALGLPIRDLFDFEEEPTHDLRKAAIASLLDSADDKTKDVVEAVMEVLIRKLESRRRSRTL